MDVFKCLYMFFGIDIKEDCVISNFYIFVSLLNFIYEEKLSGEQRMFRNGFFIVIFGFIFIEGNCVFEESVGNF